MNIADIFASVRLNLETGEFEAKALKSADIVAGKMGARMKKAAGGMLGAGVGLAFGAMLAGANQLDAATRQLQADTGMTADEAKRAQGALASMYRDNLQGFDAIGAAMAKVHNDLGLTGDAADRATAKFLKFATATGQDAGEAVSAFDDILDSWGLTAADAQVTMDKLIVSHQKFGGTLVETQRSLALLAAPMRAANFSIDDGIALLGLFGSKGLDAQQGAAAFAKALTKVKSPAELQQLIADISSTSDPFDRAAKAADLFGAKAGAKLANALGGANLDDYVISMGEAAGATEDAAAAIESGFGARFKMILKNAQGALAEFGTNFGDLIMVAALFGPQMTKAIGSGIGALTGILLPKITAAVLATGPGAAIAGSGVGTMIGTAMGAAIPLALVAAAGVGIALAFKSIVLDPGLQEQSKAIGTAVGEQIATGTTEELERSRDALAKGIADINAIPFGGFLYGDQVRDLEAQLDAVNAKLLESGADMPASLAEGIEAGKGPVEVAVEDLVKTFGTANRGIIAAGKQTGADGMAAMAAGATSARQKPLDAFESLVTMLKTAMMPAKEVARLAGQMTSKELARGLRSGDPAVRAQAQAAAKSIADRLGEIAKQGGPAGRAALHELSAGIRSKIPEVRAASLEARRAAVANLQATKGPAAVAGAAAAQSFADALASGARTAIRALPGDTIAELNAGNRTLPSGAVGTPFVARDMLANIHQGEMIIPAAESAAVRAGQAAVVGSGGGGSGGGAPVTVNVYNPKPEPASTSTERELRKLAYLGVIG